VLVAEQACPQPYRVPRAHPRGTAAFEADGVQRMLAAPGRKDQDGWLRSMDDLGEILDLG
jgi:hypothetical protein